MRSDRQYRSRYQKTATARPECVSGGPDIRTTTVEEEDEAQGRGSSTGCGRVLVGVNGDAR